MPFSNIDIRVRADRSTNLTLPNGGEVSAKLEYGRDRSDRIRMVLQRMEQGNLAHGDIRSLGKDLQAALLPGEIAKQFEQAYRALSSDERLRVRIIFESDTRDLEIYRWPWEYLYHSGLGRFLATDPKLALSRYDPPGPEGIRATPPEESLRILVIVSKAKRNTDGTLLGGVLAGKVVDTIRDLTSTLLRVERVEILEESTRRAISRAVENVKPHVVHFIGHGTFDDLAGKLSLLRKDGETADWCTAFDFSALFSRYPPRLAILQACASGEAATMGFTSVASQLIHQHNLPAVVAMQYEITNQTAIGFAERFYERLAEGAPVDVAVQTAREEITYLEGPGQVPLGHDSHDFGIPVLFMRSHEPVITTGVHEPIIAPGVWAGPVTQTKFESSVPYRKHIAKEYIGDREKVYEKELEHRSVVSVWGKSGIGKTWVGARLAIQWEKQGFYFSPYSGPPRQAFWFKCKENMGFSDLAFGIAEHLGQRGEESLWHWLQSNPNRTQAPSEVTTRLTELLDQEQYFLCFDNFHHVGNDQDVRSLFEELEEALKTTATRVILIGWQEPRIREIGGRELSMTKEDIQRWVLALRSHNKGWLDETIAAKFADRLIDRVGVNLELMKIAAIDWLEKHTTQDDAEAYLDSLDEAKIAERIFKRGNEVQAALLTILSILDEWEDRSALIALARTRGASKEELVQALNALRDAGLIQEDRRRYILHESVRDLCHERQTERKENLSDLHQRVADIHSDRGDLLSAVDHYLKAKAFSEAIQLLADNMLVITRAGGGERALEQLERIEGATLSRRDGLWVRILKGDLEAWLGKLEASQSSVKIGRQGLARIPESERPAYKYEEGRLKARLGAILGSKEELEQLEQAVQYLDQSKTLMQEYMWEEGIEGQPSRVPALLMALNNLGIAHNVLANESKGTDRASEFGKAIQSFEECINMGEAFKGIPHVDYTIPWALVNLSQVYDDRGEDDDRELALEIAHRGLEKFQEIGHQWGIGFANSTLGTIYLRRAIIEDASEHHQRGLEAYEKAAEHHQRGVEAAHKCADIEGIISSSVTLAEINIIKREWPAVDEYMEAAKEALDKVQMSDLAEYVSYFERWAKGVKYLQKGQIDEGERILHDVLEYFRGSSEDYYETLCVERDLREFNCSVPEIEAQVPPPDSMPAPVEAPALVLSPSAPVEAPTPSGQILATPAAAPSPTSPPPAQAETPAPGGQIGRYKIEAELGSGAMGIVYKAYDPNIGRFVALKVLQVTPGPYAEEWEQRFHREARAAGKLRHPNIVTVYDADAISGQWYIAMEYLEGKTLAEIIRHEGAQSLEWVTGIVTQICEALNYAHEHRVIHRDIKPSNIMVLEDGQVKVADFGLASIATDTGLTEEGAFLGTPRYMSPEQIRDPRQVDGRSDIFSLGTVVYELVTGELLFPGEQITPIYHITNTEPVDLSKLSVGLPDSIRPVLEKALAKDASERFSTCAEFSEAFVRAARDADPRPPEDKLPIAEKVKEKEMPDILSDLYDQVRQSLLDCGPFGDSGSLSAIFAHPKLNPWQNSLPQAANPTARAEAVFAFLIEKHRVDTKENALVLLLRALRDRLDPADECYHRLANLADQLEDALKNDSSTEQITQPANMTRGETSALDPEIVSMVERLVEEDKLEEALTRLSKVEGYQDEARIHIGRLSRIQRQKRLGTIDLNDVNMERTRIAEAILALIRR